MARPRGASLARFLTFFILHSTVSMWALRSFAVSRSTSASGPAFVSFSLTPGTASCSWRMLRISRPMRRLSMFLSICASRLQKLECPWPIFESNSSSSGFDQCSPTPNRYLILTPGGHQRKSAQNPGCFVDSRPFGKNSSLMPETPRTVNSVDQMASLFATSLTRFEKSSIRHSTRRTKASSAGEGESSAALARARSKQVRKPFCS
mmetsp:Transcript_72729/g.168544  ORF Transcript_72729/g.168544 Transcript_72729/m.168544 type:complete len:206 (-) Transcript_72729:158-775(-)